MPLPVIANTCRVTFHWELGDSSLTAENVMHFQATTAELGALKDAIYANMTNNMVIACSSAAEIKGLSIIPLDGSSVGLDWTEDLVNGSGSAAAVLNTAVVVSLGTSLRGRSFRGRVYLPWCSEDNLNQGIIDPDNVAVMQTAWTAFIGAMASDDHALVVASGVLEEAHVVVGATVRSVAGTQRRRQNQLR